MEAQGRKLVGGRVTTTEAPQQQQQLPCGGICSSSKWHLQRPTPLLCMLCMLCAPDLVLRAEQVLVEGATQHVGGHPHLAVWQRRGRDAVGKADGGNSIPS